MELAHSKVLILGGGPGGYVAAIRAGQLGLDTILVEQAKLGGTCLNIGCIPSKAIIHAAEEYHRARSRMNGSALGIEIRDATIDLGKTIEWKEGVVARLNAGVDGLLRRAKVRVIQGIGRILDGKTCIVDTASGSVQITTDHLVIAVGSEPVPLVDLPFGGRVLSSTEALSLTTVPQRLAVVGGGYIGLELGTAFCKLGSAVQIFEAANQLLPQYDAALTKPIVDRAKELGIELFVNTKVQRYDQAGQRLEFQTADGSNRSSVADVVLVTIGRRPRMTGFGLDLINLDMKGSAIRIDQQCRTSMRNVWAIGDITGEPMLAHRAMAQGKMVAEVIAGKKQAFDYASIPAVCFTDPEIVTVGLLPDEARAIAMETSVAVYPFAANGRAMTTEHSDGFVRIVARADDHAVVGIQAVGQGVSEMASGFSLALELSATLEDVAATIQAHPTQSEALQEAALKALGYGLHG